MNILFILYIAIYFIGTLKEKDYKRKTIPVTAILILTILLQIDFHYEKKFFVRERMIYFEDLSENVGLYWLWTFDLEPKDEYDYISAGDAQYIMHSLQSDYVIYRYIKDLDPYPGNRTDLSKRVETAIPLYDKALKLNPSIHIVHLKKADAMIKAGLYEEAVKEIKAFTDIEGENEKSLFLTSLVFLNWYHYKVAIEFIDQVISLNPDNSVYLFVRGFAHEMNQNYEKAEADYIKAMEVREGTFRIPALRLEQLP